MRTYVPVGAARPRPQWAHDEGPVAVSAEFPDAETLGAVLALSTRAPSVTNSRPWQWRVGPNTLSLYADPRRHLPRSDPDRRDMLLSGGAALHHCTVALAAIGWRAKVRRLPDPAEPGHLAAVELVPQSPGRLEVLLAAGIAHRRADRRAYSSLPVPWADIALMGARAARAGVMLRQIDPEPRLGEPSRAGQDSGVVVALGTETDDDRARLRAGEVTSLVLLSATAMGLATCPMTEPLEVPETRAAVRAEVFGSSGFPQMLVRVGWAPGTTDPLSTGTLF